MKPCFSTVLPLVAFYLLIGSVTFAQPYSAADYAKLRIELMEILDDLRWVEQQLDPIRQAAAKHEEVVSLQATCEEKTVKAMISLAPDQESAIRRWNELSHRVQGSAERSRPPHEQSDRYRKQVDELGRLKDDIMPIVDEAVLTPEVRECRRKLRQKEYEVMLEIEPRAENWLLRKESLNEAFRRLQERAEENR